MCLTLKLLLALTVVTFGKASFLEKVCKLTLDPGKACAGSSHPQSKMYYFDKMNERCSSFNYLGCEGNENKFSTSDDCIDSCQTAWFVKKNKEEEEENADMDDIERSLSDCNLKPDPGPCKALIIMYYYDPVTKACNGFGYGGCQGNANRFDEQEYCESFCMPTKGMNGNTSNNRT